MFWCNEAWPVYANIFPEPFVYRTSKQDKWITRRNVKFANRNIVLPPVSVYSIPDGYLFPQTGLIADSSERFILESSRSHTAILKQNSNRRLQRKIKTFDGDKPVTVVNVEADKFYYHWIIDVLPRLYALGRLNEKVVLLLPPDIDSTRLKFLEFCLPDNVQLQQADDYSPVHARQVLLSPVTNIQGVGILRPELLRFLRRSILSNIERTDGGKRSPRRVYISREKAPKRRIINEDELSPILDMYNIQKVCMEDLSIEEQVVLFRDAELIVSLHGSGLTNMIFARNAVVVEIFPNGKQPPRNLPIHYWGLAMSCKHKYYCLFHSNESIHVDIQVEPKRLKRVLDRAAQTQV